MAELMAGAHERRCNMLKETGTDAKQHLGSGGSLTMTAGAIDQLAELANGNAWLVHRGRFLDVSFLIEVGAASYLVRIHRGRVEAVERGPLVMPRWTFALRASEEAWATFWKAVPPPGFHDLIAMIKVRALRLEGDQHPFMANLRYFKDLMALPRAGAGGAR
jgi:hypothetical protein